VNRQTLVIKQRCTQPFSWCSPFSPHCSQRLLKPNPPALCLLFLIFFLGFWFIVLHRNRICRRSIRNHPRPLAHERSLPLTCNCGLLNVLAPVLALAVIFVGKLSWSMIHDMYTHPSGRTCATVVCGIPMSHFIIS
jgi:hypothetical protein